MKFAKSHTLPRRSMRIAAIVVSFLFLATSGVFAQLTWERTEVEEKLRFGVETGVATFRFQNTGSYPVTIRSTSTSCGCTTAAMSQTTYQPGEGGEIVTEFVVGDREGLRRNVVQVFTDDPRSPVTSLVYTADIPALMTVTPRLVRWTPDSEPTVREVRIELHPDAGIELEGLSVDNPHFSVSLVSTEEPGQFIARVTPLNTNTQQRAIISLQTRPDLENGGHFSFYAYIR